MRVNILYNFQPGPWGGGNQFLKALRAKFLERGIYTDSPEKADAILFNSHQNLKQAIKLKLKQPEKILIHRLGPVFHYHRGEQWKKYDQEIINLTNKISDGVVFQSQWALREAVRLGFNENILHEVIYNSVDGDIFKRVRKKIDKNKVKLITTSWAVNRNKGFEAYKYLDDNLDFNRYEMVFIGNSPIKFQNIRHIKPISSLNLSKELKRSDIFISAEEKEACSNSALEALACGLPVMVSKNGGTMEVVGGGGELFSKKEEIPGKIKLITENYSKYQNNIKVDSIDSVADKYLAVMRGTYKKNRKGDRSSKKIPPLYYSERKRSIYWLTSYYWKLDLIHFWIRLSSKLLNR
jgi:glycosyltransferase involved in cell wall biosynthesis